jgi:WD repeat-containing protein 48
MAFIFEKLELGSTRQSSIISLHSRTTAPGRKGSGISGLGLSTRGASGADVAATEDEVVYPEDALELVCGDIVVDPRITLATLKQYYGSGGDMLLHYRPRKGVVVQ